MKEKFNHQIQAHRLKQAGLINPKEIEESYHDPNRQSFPTYHEEILCWIAILEDGRAVKVAYQYYLDGIITLDVVRPTRVELMVEYIPFIRL
jgi:hypothetical protein